MFPAEIFSAHVFPLGQKRLLQTPESPQFLQGKYEHKKQIYTLHTMKTVKTGNHYKVIE